MNKVRITKEFGFETAHALDGYEGKCKDIHGHSYHLTITVIGEPVVDSLRSDCGMVIDFGDLKKVVMNHIVPLFDHRLILRNDSRFKGIEEKNEKIRYTAYQPTCENMLLEIVNILKLWLPSKVNLCKVMLRETANSYAEWFAADNAE